MLAEVKGKVVFDEESLILSGVDMVDSNGEPRGPKYAVAEVAQFFFCRTAHWMRWLEKEKRLYYVDSQGNKEQLHADRSSSNARTYNLALVEKIAHGLSSQGRINYSQLMYALNLVRLQAEMHGLVRPRHPVFTSLFRPVIPIPKPDVEEEDDIVGRFYSVWSGFDGGLYTFDPVHRQVPGGPSFTSGQVSKIFFDNSVSWLDKMERAIEIPVSLYQLDFQPRRVQDIELIRGISTRAKKITTIPLRDALPRKFEKARFVKVYDLALIERVCVGLFEADKISALELNRALDTVRIQAQMHDMIR